MVLEARGAQWVEGKRVQRFPALLSFPLRIEVPASAVELGSFSFCSGCISDRYRVKLFIFYFLFCHRASTKNTDVAVTRWAEQQEVGSRDFHLHRQNRILIEDIFFPSNKLTN